MSTSSTVRRWSGICGRSWHSSSSRHTWCSGGGLGDTTTLPSCSSKRPSLASWNAANSATVSKRRGGCRGSAVMAVSVARVADGSGRTRGYAAAASRRSATTSRAAACPARFAPMVLALGP